MIPLTGEVKELKYVKDIVVATADEEIALANIELKYQVGTMIEIPEQQLLLMKLLRKLNSSHLVLTI